MPYTYTISKLTPQNLALLVTTVFMLSACGSSSSGPSGFDRSSSSSRVSSSSSSQVSSIQTSSSSSISSATVSWVAGEFESVNNFWDLCEAPRTGIDPNSNAPYFDTQGSTLDENNLLRSLSDIVYLWYGEIIDQDPALFSTANYFDVLKTDAFTATGTPKDQFHWSVNTDEYNKQAQSGESAGYGVTWALLSTTPPREAVVVITQPNSPATAPDVNLSRGERIISIDGVSLVNGSDVDTLNEGLFPSTLGETHTFVIQSLNSSATRTVEMTTTTIIEAPVNIVSTIPTTTGNVGYILFNSHIATAETGLADAIDQLNTQGVSDLVLDLRYNGGGFLYIASQLGYMIGGSNTVNKTFDDLTFNDKHPTINPVTGEVLTPTLFQTKTQSGADLPTLNLDRVFVLTGNNTCSASESIMNGLRGVDIEVIQIGGTTCGKPYGAYLMPNCGTSYFTIQFKGANAKGYGDFTDGFFPGIANSSNPAELPGCEVADDYDHLLGDEDEARLAAALFYRDNSSCAATANTKVQQKISAPVYDGFIRQPRGLGDAIMQKTF